MKEAANLSGLHEANANSAGGPPRHAAIPFYDFGLYQEREIIGYALCVPKTASVLISRRNRLTSEDNVRPALFRPGRLGPAVQVEEPA